MSEDAAATEAAACFERGRAAARGGDRKAALREFVMALALDPERPAHRRAALEALRTTAGYRALPEAVLAGLARCAADPELDLQPLAMVLKQLVEHDPRLPETLARVDIDADDPGADWLLDHPLLAPVLERAINISLSVERALIAVRRQALMRGGSRRTGLMASITVQVNACAFPWAVGDDERDALARTPDPRLRAMYLPVTELSEAEAAALPPVLRERRQLARELAARAESFAALADVADATSRRVQAQYQRFPYPPWTAPAPVAAGEAPHAPRAVLSAGCGTGQGAVGLALQFPHAEVFAVDLSRASLAYAQHMADRFAPGRITFRIGDLLAVERLGRAFDLIECVGVLHHMADPAAGLAALVGALRPGGAIKLGLYSERGRAGVIAARAFAARHGCGDTPDDMRRFRVAVAALPVTDPARGIVDSIDFFSLDALHDLVFNVQELRFTPRGLKRLVAGAGLEFLGFVPSPGLDLAAYLADNPGDPGGRDLDHWDDFERRRPDSFAHMFVFWCRKPVAP